MGRRWRADRGHWRISSVAEGLRRLAAVRSSNSRRDEAAFSGVIIHYRTMTRTSLDLWCSRNAESRALRNDLRMRIIQHGFFQILNHSQLTAVLFGPDLFITVLTQFNRLHNVSKQQTAPVPALYTSRNNISNADTNRGTDSQITSDFRYSKGETSTADSMGGRRG